MQNRPVTSTPLDRRLGLGDAVLIGLGSMIGAGVFVVFAPAADAAGSGLFAALGVVAVIAWCNARSTAQLAAVHPTSGGAYAYGRAELGPWWGFVAGWSFVLGKTASCAAMALVVAAYIAPDGWERPVAVVVVVALVVVNVLGISKTAALTRVIVVLVLVVLAVVVAAGVAASASGGGPAVRLEGSSAYGVLQAAGLLFFAFAGYARIATLGEEVRDPRRTIPRAVTIAFATALGVYAAIAFVCVLVLGVDRLATSTEPLVDVVHAAGWDALGPVVRVGAALAALGALLGLLAGIGRTALAMARERDLPGWLAHVESRSRVPARAEAVVGASAILLVLVADVTAAVALSSVGVLLYYAVANLSALRLVRRSRSVRGLAVSAFVGLAGCVVLVVTLPPLPVACGLAVVALGIGGRALVIGRRGRRSVRAE
ncbi:amino acid/polyamine/organocation transporter (APC superfamily) [Labedella gwakjiensis]|uniref:APC family permease n=1 Tax=Labedella gwakjiensis TaxID=390269 RepID=A0A2P8GR31_9MICO|nr:APC family permease [Labedella gwakjiensis]PSL36433.1 amino acid/polyamine/organocation transporter (APC superfamily) [Labedella gwakjiensis]RUQ85641.1 APC family permease [Labedella gwakjiensis]